MKAAPEGVGMLKNSLLKAGPVIRKFGCDLFAPGGLTPVLHGSLFALDHLRGDKKHAVSGVLRDQQGNQFDCTGTVNGLTFAIKEKPLGRPSKDMRNVAVYMAFECFVAELGPHAKAARLAREKLLAYWQEREWKGMPDETTCNTLIRKGQRVFLNTLKTPGDRFRHISDDGLDGLLIAMPSGCIQCSPGNFIKGNGSGWIWRYGEEVSRFGVISQTTHISHLRRPF